MYQVTWVRLIDKVIGSAPFAVATVLSVFMAGLAAKQTGVAVTALMVGQFLALFIN